MCKIFNFTERETLNDGQVREMQKSVINTLTSAIRHLDMASTTLEYNACKPTKAYEHTQQANFILKNLVSDLKLDTRL